MEIVQTKKPHAQKFGDREREASDKKNFSKDITF